LDSSSTEWFDICLERIDCTLEKQFPSVVLSGYYGYGNVGDEAVLGGIIASLRHLIPEVQLTVLTSDPELTSRLHPGVFTARRYNPVDLVKSMRAADVLISGGGSLLQDATSARSSYYYLAVLHLARYLGCKCVIYAQGVGPLNSVSIQRAVGAELTRADVITVRDVQSRELLASIGVDEERVEVTVDPAFLVDADYESADAVLKEYGLEDKSILGVCLRPWPGLEKVLPDLRKGIIEFCHKNGAKAIALPMQESEDTEIAQQLDIGSIIHCNGDFRLMKGILARCRGVLAMRLHALIFAAAEGVPFQSLVYDPKVSSFARLMTNTEGILIDGVEAERLVVSLTDVWCDASDQRSILSSLRTRMREDALLPAYKTLELLGMDIGKEHL